MQCDAGSLAELARFVPSMSNIAEVAAFAAYNENMSTSVMYDSESNTVSTTVALGAAVTVGPSFHYRDPYTGAGDIFKEFSDFISLLMDGAA